MPNVKSKYKGGTKGNNKTSKDVKKAQKKKGLGNVAGKVSKKSAKTTTAVQKPKTQKPKTPKVQKKTFDNAKTVKPTAQFKVTNTSAQYKSFRNSNLYNKPQEKESDPLKKYRDAVSKSQNANLLTGASRETTTKLATEKQQKKIAKTQTKALKEQYYGSEDWKKTKEQMKKANRKAWRDALREAGYTKEQAKEWMNSKEGKSARKESYYSYKDAVKGDINTQIKNNVKKDVADTYNLKSSSLNSEEFAQMMYASRLGRKQGNKALDAFGGKNLKYKIGAKTAEGAYKSKAATGVMQGLSYADVFSGVGAYDKASKTAIEKTKSSAGYNIGYGAGMAGQMAMGGVGAKGSSVAGKLGLETAKKGGKLTAKQSAKNFAKRGIGELVAETPVNVLDAAKMSLDENGKVNKKEMAKWVAINSALTSGVGRGTEAIGGISAKKLSKETKELLAKKASGTLTKEETAKLVKNIKKLDSKVNAETLSGEIAKRNKSDIRENANKLKWEEKVRKTKDKGFNDEANKKQYLDDYLNERVSPTKKADNGITPQMEKTTPQQPITASNKALEALPKEDLDTFIKNRAIESPSYEVQPDGTVIDKNTGVVHEATPETIEQAKQLADIEKHMPISGATKETDAEFAKELTAEPRKGKDVGKEMYKALSVTRKFTDKVSRGFVNSFRNWDKVIDSVEDPILRNRAKSLVQNVRMTKSKALSEVKDEFASIYKEFNVVGNKEKRADFERYCDLLHDYERAKGDTEYLGIKGETKEETLKLIIGEIRNLETKYAKDIKSLKGFQEKIVKYFDKQLDEDVRCGFETEGGAKALRTAYKNYIPTFRKVDEALNYPPSHQYHFTMAHEAVGAESEEGLKSLLDRAIDKTSITYRRAALNDLMNCVADLNGVRVSDLPKNVNPDELLHSSTLTFNDHGKYYVQFWKDGEEKSLEINEGMYKGLRQWSGEDKLAMMECKLLNNKAINGISHFFKAWITDYSLVFGVRNFMRDTQTGLFYTQNPLRYARNIPRGVLCVLADTKTINALSEVPGVFSEKTIERIKSYQGIMEAYKKNGGEFAQLVKSTNPEKDIKRMLKGRNGLLTFIKEVNSSFEMIPRMAEFCSSVEEKTMKNAQIKSDEWYKMSHIDRLRLMEKTLENNDVVAEAMYRAKEVTLNFDRSGYIGRWLNSGYVPFFNPAVQGLSKLGRVLSKESKTGKEFAKMLAMFAVGGAGVEAGFQMTIGQMEEYQNISDYHKTSAYCIPLAPLFNRFGCDFKDTDFIKIPKAREIAALTGPIQWGFQHMKYHCAGKDEDLFHSLVDVDIDALNSNKGILERITHPISVSGNMNTWWEQIGPVSPISDNLLYAPFRIAAGKNWYGGYIESFEDADLINAGKSYKAYDENTSMFSVGVSKALNEGADKLGDFLGLDKDTKKWLKTKVWSPKKLDDLFDSYLGGIYDMTIAQTSMKNSNLTDTVNAVKNDLSGENKSPLSGYKNIVKLLASPFGNAFMLDTVITNRHKQDTYQLKSDIKEDMDKTIRGLGLSKDAELSDIKKALGEKYGYDSKEYEHYMERNAKLMRVNQSAAYVSTQYDEMIASVYMNEKLNTKQKQYWVRKIKEEQNTLLEGRRDGKIYANADPMKWAYEATRQNGKKLFSADQVVDMCSYTFANGSNVIGDAYKKYVKNGGNKDTFIRGTLEMREVLRSCGDSLTFPTYNVCAYTLASKEASTGKKWDKMLKAYEIKDGTYTDALNYFRNGTSSKYGKATIETYKAGHRRVVQGGIDIGKYVGQMDSWEIVNSLAGSKTESGRPMLDRAYYAEGYYAWKTMNAGRCLASDKYKKSGWSNEKISKFCEKNGFTYKNDQKPDSEKVRKAIEKEYPKASAEEKAAVFEEICPTVKNPFGDVGDYSVDGDTGIAYSSYGHGRRRHGWHHGHGGGGGGSLKKNKSSAKMKVTDFTKDSTLDEAYRKKLKERMDKLK